MRKRVVAAVLVLMMALGAAVGLPSAASAGGSDCEYQGRSGTYSCSGSRGGGSSYHETRNEQVVVFGGANGGRDAVVRSYGCVYTPNGIVCHQNDA